MEDASSPIILLMGYTQVAPFGGHIPERDVKPSKRQKKQLSLLSLLRDLLNIRFRVDADLLFVAAKTFETDNTVFFRK